MSDSMEHDKTTSVTFLSGPLPPRPRLHRRNESLFASIYFFLSDNTICFVHQTAALSQPNHLTNPPPPPPVNELID